MSAHVYGRARRGRARLLLLAAIATVVGLLFVATSCAGGSSGRSQTISYIIPMGTADKAAHGELISVMPNTVVFHVGDTIFVRNDDRADHVLGPYYVKAGESFELKYGTPGHMTGTCSLSANGRYEIDVLP